MIEGVKVTLLKQFFDERGKVMHMLKSSDPNFKEFGEIYFSCIYPGSIKGWHQHKLFTLNYAVPHGQIKFVLYEDRPGSLTEGELQEIFLGPDNYCLVSVPPLVWNGFKGYGNEMAFLANCATAPHDSNELSRLDPFDPCIPYNWDLKHG